MFILKVQGQAKIPNYIQLRDDKFNLVAYFRVDRPLNNLQKYGLEGKEVELKEVIDKLEYGKLVKLDI